MAIRLKSWFFTTSGDQQVGGFWRRFVGGGISKPTQATFEDLTDSVAFKSQLTDGASDNGRTVNHSSGSPLQGLVTTAVDEDIVDDTKEKADYTSNTPIVAKAYQMTAAQGVDQTITDAADKRLIDVVKSGTTRRVYTISLASAFITWLNNVRTQLTQALADIATLDGRVDTAETDIDTLQSDVVTLDGRVDALEAGITGNLKGTAILTNGVDFGVSVTSGNSQGVSNITVHYEIQNNNVVAVFYILVLKPNGFNFNIDIDLTAATAGIVALADIKPTSNFAANRTQISISTIDTGVYQFVSMKELIGTKTLRIDGIMQGPTEDGTLRLLTHYSL